MELILTVGAAVPSPGELLGQAAELQKFFRKAAAADKAKYSVTPATSKNDAVAVIHSDDGDRIVLYVNSSEHLDSEDITPATTVAGVVAQVAEMLAETAEFDGEVSVKPFADDFSGAEGYSAFWTPKGESEVRANITAVINPPIETILSCGDPRKLLEMEEDPDWVGRHDLTAGLLRYADYSRARIVQYKMSDVAGWLADGRVPGYRAAGPHGLIRTEVVENA